MHAIESTGSVHTGGSGQFSRRTQNFVASSQQAECTTINKANRNIPNLAPLFGSVQRDFFQMRGMLEGFYGKNYTPEERDDLIRFISRHHFNTYIYAPKIDHKQRDRWWEPYTAKELAGLQQNIKTAQANGITFNYALTCGMPRNPLKALALRLPRSFPMKFLREKMIQLVSRTALSQIPFQYGAQRDFDVITQKLKVFYDMGVRSFSLLYDDMDGDIKDASDRVRYRNRYAAAHVDFSNRVFRWLKQLDPSIKLAVCPTDYHGRAPFSQYIRDLGTGLDPEIDIYYTGPETCSPSINRADADAFAKDIRRKPLIWDNYPVNDLHMQPELHMGALRGRSPDLYQGVKGLFANAMNLPESSKIPLATIGDYLSGPARYQPNVSLAKAIEEVAGPGTSESLVPIIQNTELSAQKPKQSELGHLTQIALQAHSAGQAQQVQQAFDALSYRLWQLNQACAQAQERIQNFKLKEEIQPWIKALQHGCTAGLAAVKVLNPSEARQTKVAAKAIMLSHWQAMKQTGRKTNAEDLKPLVDLAIKK